MRRFLTSVTAVFVVAFLWVLIASPVIHAATDASWSGDQVSYQGHSYDKKTADGTTPPGATKGSDYYLYLATDSTAHIITFSSSTPDTATAATYTVYAAGANGIRGSPINGPTALSITPKKASASATQAAWKDGSIQFDGRLYSGTTGNPYLATGAIPAGLIKDTQYYQSIGTDGIARIIYFAPGIDVKTATNATYQEFQASASGIGATRGASKSITLTPVADSPSDGPVTASNSCAVEGIGWIVCPVSDFLAKGMDQIFEMLKGFLMVEPISTQSSSPLYQSWSLVRSIANVAFVIVFLVIIYSQLTGLGVTNYGLKKLIPRLIVAALLVNLSYYICAIAVDVSNVAGSGLQSLLVGMRDGLNMQNPHSIASWQSVTGFVLADTAVTGAAAVTIGGVVITSGASLGAALILLLPMLLALILAVLVALIVLAARQALIIILIILAPLAFVAYLLPNTEKLFERWRDIFITMLVFFPLFALIFGGSQLAAFLIIQNAHDINVILLAMFVQVAPLVLTPLLVRFSGGVIGRIAGLVNDPKKGLIDRTRTWAKGQSEYMAARNMARTDPVRRRQVFRRFALDADQRRRAQEERLSTYKEASDARWTGTQQYSDIQQQLRYAQDSKTEGVEAANLRYESSKSVVGNVRNVDLRVRELKLRNENATAHNDNLWELNHTAGVTEQRLRSRVLKDTQSRIHSRHDAEYEEFKQGRMGHFPATAAVAAMLNQSQIDTRLLSMNAMRAESAKRAVTEQFTADLRANVQRIDGQLLQTYAGGVQGISGAQRALAAAIDAQSKAGNEAVSNAAAILSNGNYGDNTITEIALGRSAGTSVIITDEMRLAAIRKTAAGQNAGEIIKLMEGLEINTTADNQDFRQEFVEALLPNSLRPKFAGAAILGDIRQGFAPAPGKARIDEYNALAVNANKYGAAEVLVNTDRDFLISLYGTLNNNLSAVYISPQAKAKIKSEIQLARTDHRFSGRIGERDQVLKDIYRIL